MKFHWIILPGSASILMLAVGLFLCLEHPVAFRNSIVIRVFPEGASTRLAADPEGFDIAPLLKSINFWRSMEYDIDPEIRYRKTMLEGRGNCSNMALGFAYLLSVECRKYQILHLLYPSGFLEGNGHTVVNTAYRLNGRTQTGVIDIFEGGVAILEGRVLGLDDLRHGDLAKARILSLQRDGDTLTTTYMSRGERPEIGSISSVECERYFRWTKRIYFPMGSDKLEKYIYDAASLVLGFYPDVYVEAADFQTLFESHGKIRFLSIAFIWLVRGLLMAVPMALCLVFGTYWSRWRNRSLYSGPPAGSMPAADRTATYRVSTCRRVSSLS